MNKAMFVDVLVFFVTSFFMTFVVVGDFRWLWILAPLASIRIWQMRGWKSKTSGILTGFKLLKIVSSAIAVVLVNYGQTNKVPDFAVNLCLGINILEAVLTDLQVQGKYGIPNAMSGLLLVSNLWNHEAGQQTMVKNGYFLFTLSKSWVIGYTLWNGAFVHGVGLSLSFGLILFTPYVVAFWILNMPNVWLSARTYSLVVNQGLRGGQLFWIFVPNGKSAVTDLEGDNTTRNQRVRLIWGTFNLVAIVFFCELNKGKFAES